MTRIEAGQHIGQYQVRRAASVMSGKNRVWHVRCDLCGETFKRRTDKLAKSHGCQDPRRKHLHGHLTGSAS